MDFNEENKVIIASMNQEEAKAFVRFLRSEILRHRRDTDEAIDLIIEVKKMFDLELEE